MDFLSRYFTYCALVGALCLTFSAPAFAISNTTGYSWQQSSDGSYHVYDPDGSRISSDFDSGSSFAEGASGGVIETVPPPFLTVDGATGNVTVGLSRSLTVGDLVDGLGKCFSLDNPIGLTVIGVSTLAPFALAVYNDYENSAHPSSPSSDPTSYSCTGVSYSVPAQHFIVPNGNYFHSSCDSPSGFCTAYYDSGLHVIIVAVPLTCADGANPVPSGATVPTDLPLWIDTHYNEDELGTDVSKALVDNPSDAPELATQLADNDAPLASPVPYTYDPTSNSLAESPSTTTSTDPSTGESTSTTTTPSFDVTPAPDGGLDVTKKLTSVTTSCTAADSCTVTNNTTKSTTPKTASPFVAPTTSTPTASTSSVHSFPLSLVVPAQSHAHCPKHLSFTALSHSFHIPLLPLCTLATDVNPYVESLGAVGAGIVIFR